MTTTHNIPRTLQRIDWIGLGADSVKIIIRNLDANTDDLEKLYRKFAFKKNLLSIFFTLIIVFCFELYPWLGSCQWDAFFGTSLVLRVLSSLGTTCVHNFIITLIWNGSGFRWNRSRHSRISQGFKVRQTKLYVETKALFYWRPNIGL